ncbi:Tyrosinase copper-binding domain and ShKT domain and Uncharacterised domain, di-copper centre-containing protein [Strongyloides ratti]|uniref:Tyrosinase copper-binding domain and ShKT domain and Uncharacterized domain, di-copper centre-containing protein n=1 Tax=Strongyloides ratti TaxID=34506 RepID=A0A090L5U2_STRRB|nr:Tyrosinase copper-binding domain and ShKT domain and Uncharacterised domain, di-copper centre-containing protein [Strongyloides ratti]CEF65087.1 Tyrosinase copper-binding domain and ShKT domain and Uncharacterised domain, di-copper centre-containing protein [Strongyloides ratti]
MIIFKSIVFIFYIIFTFFTLQSTSLDCSKAPTQALKIVCAQIQKWDEGSRKSPQLTPSIALPPAIPGQPAPMIAAEIAPIARTAAQCMDIGCLCSFIGGNGSPGNNNCVLSNGQKLNKALRKELRMLTTEERQRYHTAVQRLKANGDFTNFAQIHAQFSSSGGAHSGPAFLPWHREFLKRYEIALRQIDPSVALPYWDSTLESELPTPADSILFSDLFAGTTDAQGNVVTGPFKGFSTTSGAPNIKRRVGAQGSVFKESEVNYILQQTKVDQVLSFTAPQQGCPAQIQWNALEYTHGNVHIFVGGDMYETSTAGNDPIFWNHHSFVDYIWEMWRQNKQNRFDREQSYPQDMQQCSSANHFASGLMRPFEPWRNIDGLNNKYTDNMYEYAPRPTCSPSKPSCNSEFLFCKITGNIGKCTAKVKPTGNCRGLEGSNGACYESQCINGKCVSSVPNPITTPKPAVLPTRPPPFVRVTNCFNENECCSTWARNGECQRNAPYMNAWCAASCNKCKFNYDINAECSDRHMNCGLWSRSGECQKNLLWMTENCRKSCNKCDITRAAKCSGGGRTFVTTPRPPVPSVNGNPQDRSTCKSVGCFNENVCCPIWGIMGECARNPFWMSCNCRVSCGFCVPNDYYYGSCNDYHRQCQEWANRGECQKNPWMTENCRSSCQSCYSQYELRSMCRSGTKPIGGFVSWGRDMNWELGLRFR